MAHRILAAAVVCGVVVTACGGGAAPRLSIEGAEITLPKLADGPLPALPVSPDAAVGSPLPEITVRQLNGDGGFVQFKNELPSDRPLLIWFWAPH